jgi:hypothetical protein
MASSCGIHLDRHHLSVVVLDGSAKKHKLTTYATVEIPPGEDPVVVGAAALRDVLKGQKIPGDSIGLAVDSGLAAFRMLSLPFDDRSKIEDVIKFEVESDLPQWDIDDVVIDYLVLDTKPGVESNLLVTAVPKDVLAERIAICEKAGAEPIDVELDGSALFEVAHAAEVLDEEAASILVQVGDLTTTVVVADGTRLSSIRAVRVGAFTPPTPEPAAGDDEGDGEAPAASAVSEEERLAQTVQRLRRELTRSLTAAGARNPVQGIWICGHELPGLEGETLLDVPVRRLEPLPHDAGVPESSELAIAYGAALRRLGGGVLAPHLRREELHFSGKFERLELPLAVFSLLLVTLLGIQLIVTNKRILWDDEGDLDRNLRGNMQIWLEASNQFMLPNPDGGYPGRLRNPPDSIANYARLAERGEDAELTKYQEIRRIETRLQNEIIALQKELGQISEIVQPQSAFEGMTLVLTTMDEMGEQLGRFGIRQLTSDFVPGRAGKDDTVLVKLDLDFFANDDLTATRHYTDFQKALRDQPWCLSCEDKGTKVLDSGDGIYVDGIAIRIDLNLVPDEES